MGVLPEDENRLRMKGEQLTQVPSYKSGKGTPTVKPKQVTTEDLERRSRGVSLLLVVPEAHEHQGQLLTLASSSGAAAVLPVGADRPALLVRYLRELLQLEGQEEI